MGIFMRGGRVVTPIPTPILWLAKKVSIFGTKKTNIPIIGKICIKLCHDVIINIMTLTRWKGRWATVETRQWADWGKILWAVVRCRCSKLCFLQLKWICYHHHHHRGYPAYSHHDKVPPWWGNVSNDEGGNVSVSKTHQAPYTMMNYILEFICISGNPYNIWQLRNEYSNWLFSYIYRRIWSGR